jgi:hypothetical protein
MPERREGSLLTISGPEKSANPLKTNDPEKRRNHRQESSKVVKTGRKALIQNNFQ